MRTVTSMQELETGDFAIPRWLLYSPDSIRVVNWNVNRGLQLQRVIEFLASAKADLILLQETDVNARRTHHLIKYCEGNCAEAPDELCLRT